VVHELATVGGEMTIDELAAASGTSTRNIRSLQSMGLMERPRLRGRTGLYGVRHLDRLLTILRLQAQGFSLPSLQLLYQAQREGRSLGEVLGMAGRPLIGAIDADATDVYGFSELPVTQGRPFLSVVPTTVWRQTEAS
jgi:DNA-binding transcriptional MerR regulator